MHIKNFVYTHLAPPSFWAFAGVAYGYPRCCIEHFLEKIAENPDDPWGDDNLEGWFVGSGYIACPECRKLPEAEIRSAIDSNRSVSIPFPYSNIGDGELSKIVKRFIKRGFPSNYSSLDFYIKENAQEFAKAKRRQNFTAKQNSEVTKAHNALVNEFFLRHKRKLGRARINRYSGTAIEVTNTPMTAEGLVVFLGTFKKKYFWALCDNAKLVAPESAVYGFIPPSGYSVLKNKESIRILCEELYETGWDEEKEQYDYSVINDELNKTEFYTEEFSFPIKPRIGGEWDLHCGPQLVREVICTIVNENYDLSHEDDLPGPELAFYTVNFQHPKYGWMDLRKYRQFCSENDYLPRHLKEEYYFYAHQSWTFERFVELKIKEAKANGADEEKIELLEMYLGQALGNKAIMAGNYVQLRYEDQYVYIKDRQWINWLWMSFHNLCGDLGLLFFLVFDKDGNVVVDNQERPFKQRNVIDVQELVDNSLKTGSVYEPAGQRSELDDAIVDRWNLMVDSASGIDSEVFAKPCAEGFHSGLLTSEGISAGNIEAMREAIADSKKNGTGLQPSNFELYQKAGATGSDQNLRFDADDLNYALPGDNDPLVVLAANKTEGESELKIAKGRVPSEPKEGGKNAYTVAAIKTVIAEEGLDLLATLKAPDQPN